MWRRSEIRQRAWRFDYSFSGGSDGKNPESGLIDINGTLYGATAYGGGSGPKTGGTVYSITL